MKPFYDLLNPKLSCVSFPQEFFIPSVLFLFIAGESRDKAPADQLTLQLKSPRPLNMSIVFFLIFHSLQSQDFNRGFNRSLGTILGTNLSDELLNRNIFELLLLLLVALVPSSRSPDRSRTALFDQKASTLDFDKHRRLFLPSILSSILLFIISSKLFV